MIGNIDREVLVGFVEEAESYLPAIRAGLAAYQVDPTRLEGLETAHRHIHTIKGAAAMVGLAGLSQLAYHLEKAIEEIGSGELTLDQTTATWLANTLASLETYLAGAVAGQEEDVAHLAQVTEAYQHLRAGATNTTTAVPLEPVDPTPQFDDIAAELLEAFFLEAEDHLRTISLALANLAKEPGDRAALQNVRRSVHTLKGAAGTVGLPVLAELSHRMEDLLDQLYAQERSLDPPLLELLLASADALEDLTQDTVQAETLQDLYRRYDQLFGLGEEAAIDPGELTSLARPAGKSAVSGATAGTEETGRRESSEVVRVPIERLDELIRLVGELVITRTSFEQRMGDFIREVEELRPSIERLRHISTKLETDYEVSTLGNGFRRLALAGQDVPQKIGIAPGPGLNIAYSPVQAQEFDELEFDRYTEFHLLSRELAETTGDVNIISNAMNALIGDFDTILSRQSRLSSELQEKLMRTRMVPVGTLTARLHRTVRVVAQKQGKQVDLVVEGEQIELDKTVLEEISDPLLHLLRNAVDHGIESPARRRTLGKPERGLIQLQVYQEGNQVVIRISDDGAGLEPELIRARAVSGGYISGAEAPRLTHEELYALIFLPGFSTAEIVSDVSGRGIGMDVVKTNVAKLKGTVAIDSTPGVKTTFTIRLPMTMAVTRALLVKSHGEIFAIPLNAISQILRVGRQEFEQVGHEPVVRLAGRVYPVLHLGQILHLNQPADETVERPPVLILNTGGQEVALEVDYILYGREIVIKNLGSHLRRVHGIMGATLMGDGRVVLILNPAELLSEPAKTSGRSGSSPAASLPETWHIMVVDDSISVRRIVSNLIKSAGWQPIMAKDGVEALEIIQQSPRLPDLILLDVEMPRMDGYELTAILRGRDTYKNIPIVMLTSRAGEKHRRKAFELGVSEYVVKPYQDEVLLGAVRQLVRASRGVNVA